MKLYKIRDKKTGLFSTGGSYVRWSTLGKTWSAIGHVKSHLTMVKGYNQDYYGRNNPYADAELVEVEFVVKTATDIKDIK